MAIVQALFYQKINIYSLATVVSYINICIIRCPVGSKSLYTGLELFTHRVENVLLSFVEWQSFYLWQSCFFHNSTYNTAAQCQIWWNFLSKNVNEVVAFQVSTKVAFSAFEQSRMFSFWKFLPLAENRSRSQRLKNSLIAISSDLLSLFTKREVRVKQLF